MIRVIGAELRRSNARTLAILLFVVGGLFLAGMVRVWNRQWLMFSYVQVSILFFLVPLALAGGAMLGRRERRTRAAELMGTTGRPRWQRVTPPAAALALAVTAVQLLFLGLGAAEIALTGGFLSLGGAVAQLVDLTLLVGAAWVGLAAGRAWSSPVVPPFLAAVGVLVQLGAQYSDPGSRLQSLSLMVQPPNLPWESANPEALLGRLALGTGFLLGGLLLITAASWLTRIMGVATLAVGIVLATLVTPTGWTGRYQVDPAAQRLVCADGGPRVCVTAIHAYDLQAVAPAVRTAIARLAKLPGAPTRGVEWRADAVSQADSSQFWGSKPKNPPGTVLFRLDLEDGSPSASDVTASILNGAGTTMNGCEPGDPVALGAAGAWLMGTETLPLHDEDFSYSGEMTGQIRATVARLRKLPEDEQVRRVTALRDAAGACRTGNLLALLTGKSTE